jgi:hypothetical protein
MKVLSTKTIKILPNKSIYRKLGRSSHGFNESIAELVDNSIDAMTDAQREGKEKLEINIDLIYRKQKPGTEYITVRDNAKGMTETEAAKAIVLAESAKTTEELGEYGFGLKTAALSIGKVFTISTGKIDVPEATSLRFDEDDWEKNEELSWDSFPCQIVEKPKGEHGTNIKIEKLKIRLNDAKLQSLFVDMGRRYRTYIERGNVIIRINSVKCIAEKIKWATGYPEDFEISTKFGKVYGKLGLMTEGSQKGLYGLDLFKRNRLIKPYAKFGIPEHPTVATIMGELHMNFVPVTHEKNKFIEDSLEYEEVEKQCKDSEIFKKIIREARKTQTERTIDEKTNEKVKNWEDMIAQAYRDPELRDMVNSNVKGKDDAENKQEKGVNEKVNVEKRDQQIKPAEQENKEPETHRDRKPKKIHEVIRHILTIFGKTFVFKHEWIYSPGLGRKDYKKEENGPLTIFTNTAFPAFSATKDQPFYAANNIIESIAELYAKEGNLGIDKMNEAKDLALRKVAEIKNQIEEEKKEVDKRSRIGVIKAK